MPLIEASPTAPINGRASEVHACSVGEQQQILVVSLVEAPVVNGV